MTSTPPPPAQPGGPDPRDATQVPAAPGRDRGAAPSIGQTFGPYRIDRVIGVGGMGMVFEARDQRLGRSVAVKVVLGQYAESEVFMERFQREAATLARLDSPHVVSIYDHGEQDGWPFIVTQYAAGGELGKLLQNRGAMPPGLAALVCSQVADALVAAHAVGVVHRDVKPANVLLRDDRLDRLHVYLCDFGVALTEGSGLTQPGSVAGTWNYLAPERVDGEHGSPVSDVYAVGCLFYEVLTGRPPYLGSDVEVAIEHMRSPVPQLPGDDEFTQRANRVLALTMAKDPAERYPSAAVLRDELRDIAQLYSTTTNVIGAGRTPRGSRGSRGSRASTVAPTPAAALFGNGAATPTRRPRTRLVLAGVAALAVVAAGGVAFAVTRGGDSPAPGPVTASSDAAPPVGGGTPGVVGDLDGNGFGDVAWSSFVDGGHLHLSDGTTLDPTTVRRNTATPPTVMGDVDGDGRTDLVQIAGKSPTLGVVVVNPRNSNPTSTLTVPAVDTDARFDDPTVSLGDVDGDGDADLLVATRMDKTLTISVATSNGDTTFAQPTTWWSGTYDLIDGTLTLGDLDGDGRDDVVLGHIDTGLSDGARDTAQVLHSDGTKLTPLGDPLVIPEQLGDTFLIVGSLDLADITGDGTPSLVGFTTSDDTAVVWTWDDTTSSFTDPTIAFQTDTPLSSSYTIGVAVSDVDGDGKDDLVVVSDGDVSVLRSTGTAFELAPAYGFTPKDNGGTVLIKAATHPS